MKLLGDNHFHHHLHLVNYSHALLYKQPLLQQNSHCPTKHKYEEINIIFNNYLQIGNKTNIELKFYLNAYILELKKNSIKLLSDQQKKNSFFTYKSIDRNIKYIR